MSATSFVMPNDLSDLCRVCLQLPEESQYLDLATIYDEEDNLTYGECFTICTHIDLNAGEGVPHHLCKSCGLELQMSYDFHKKIEESKRVIEQCQKQIYEQKANVVGAVASIEQPNNVNSDALEEMDIVQLINNKYEISDDEDELAETSQELEEMCGMQHENEQHFEREPHEDEETDEMDIINRICQIEANTQLEVPPDKDFNTSLKPLNDHDIEGDEDEMEDYQNLEALEDEEKRRTFLPNIKIKTEILNDDQHIKIKEEFKTPTETHSVATEHFEEIQNEISTDSNYNSHDPLVANKTINDDIIKIENETLSEYTVTSPTIIPGINPPIPKHFPYEQRHPAGPPYGCELCGHSMPTKNALYKHRLRKHNLKGFQRQPITQPISCHLCSKVFITMSSLRQHMDAGHLNKSFVCEHCGHNLPTKNALCQHRLRKHRDIEKQQKKLLQLKCSLCTDSFNTAESLNLHKLSSHTKKHTVSETNEWFQCDDCGHKLPTKNALCQHRLRKHRHKKDTKSCYRCRYCDIVLPSNEILQSHLLELHEVLPALKQLVDRL
ncbi:PR domain zinc finger protein 15 isoform X3 [Calliphora vicina]|uniref:PR domain zinc finger protein 15 isoform X3 n=1 Tax=Calliphora vicina TaxID=7373 RepID=UPI00325A813D